MVIQRNQPIVVWGWAEANATIKISFNNLEHTSIVNDKGDWKVTLPMMKEGGPFEMILSSSDEKIVIMDILIGILQT